MTVGISGYSEAICAAKRAKCATKPSKPAWKLIARPCEPEWTPVRNSAAPAPNSAANWSASAKKQEKQPGKKPANSAGRLGNTGLRPVSEVGQAPGLSVFTT